MEKKNKISRLSIAEIIGNTPLVELKFLTLGLYSSIQLKLEYMNPFGSIKDRIARSMLESSERMGKLKEGMKVIEPTSGNTGISLAHICAAKKYPITLVMPESMSLERRTLLLMLGAELILTPSTLGMRGAVLKAQEICAQDPTFYMLQQFDHPANPEIHRRTTAEEIWNATEGAVDIFVAGVGTGGTITGVGEILKSRNSQCRIVAVEPKESAVLSGQAPGPHKIQGIGAGFIPSILNRQIIDEIITVSSEEAFQMARTATKSEGIPLGISSGATLKAAMQLAARPENKGKRIVCMAASATERYLSTLLCEPERKQALQLQPQAPSSVQTSSKDK